MKRYSIFQKDKLLFHYFERRGGGLDADFERMNAQPSVKQFHVVWSPCQVPLAVRKGEWWAEMAELFHMV